MFLILQLVLLPLLFCCICAQKMHMAICLEGVQAHLRILECYVSSASFACVADLACAMPTNERSAESAATPDLNCWSIWWSCMRLLDERNAWDLF